MLGFHLYLGLVRLCDMHPIVSHNKPKQLEHWLIQMVSVDIKMKNGEEFCSDCRICPRLGIW